MASPGNQHCDNCIGTLSFPIAYSYRQEIVICVCICNVCLCVSLVIVCPPKRLNESKCRLDADLAWAQGTMD